MGHVREDTRLELERALRTAGLELIRFERRGLNRFNNVKDAIHSGWRTGTHLSLRRTLGGRGSEAARPRPDPGGAEVPAPLREGLLGSFIGEWDMGPSMSHHVPL